MNEKVKVGTFQKAVIIPVWIAWFVMVYAVWDLSIYTQYIGWQYIIVPVIAIFLVFIVAVLNTKEVLESE